MRGLARVFEKALARAFGRGVYPDADGWWWLGPLLAAIALAGLSFWLLRHHLKRRWFGAAGIGMASFLCVAAIQGGDYNWIREQSLRRDAQSALKNALADPDSANVAITELVWLRDGEAAVCGRFNARARGGGFQGQTNFAARVGRTSSDTQLFIDLDRATRNEPSLSTLRQDLNWFEVRDDSARCACPNVRNTFDAHPRCERTYVTERTRYDIHMREVWQPEDVLPSEEPADPAAAPY
jgi:hypothetical protein